MSKERFGRSKPERTTQRVAQAEPASISSATSGVAVAVQAITVGRPSRSIAFGSRR